MSRLKLGIKGFADRLVENVAPRTEWDDIEDMIDFSAFKEVLESSLSQAGAGRPSYPPLMMVKGLLIQVMYNLSDDRTLGRSFVFPSFLWLCHR